MVYSAAYWVKSKNEEMSKIGFNGIFCFITSSLDSKQLTASQRDNLLGSIDEQESIGYVIRILTPKEICANMLQSY